MTGLWLMRDEGSGRGGRAVAWRHEALRHEAVVLGGAGGGTVSHEPGEPPATGHWAHSARWVGLRNLPPVLSPARLPLCVLSSIPIRDHWMHARSAAAPWCFSA